MIVDYTLRMDAINFTEKYNWNKTLVEKIPISGSRGQSASVYVYVGNLKAEHGIQGKDATKQKGWILSFYS